MDPRQNRVNQPSVSNMERNQHQNQYQQAFNISRTERSVLYLTLPVPITNGTLSPAMQIQIGNQGPLQTTTAQASVFTSTGQLVSQMTSASAQTVMSSQILQPQVSSGLSALRARPGSVTVAPASAGRVVVGSQVIPSGPIANSRQAVLPESHPATLPVIDASRNQSVCDTNKVTGSEYIDISQNSVDSNESFEIADLILTSVVEGRSRSVSVKRENDRNPTDFKDPENRKVATDFLQKLKEAKDAVQKVKDMQCMHPDIIDAVKQLALNKARQCPAANKPQQQTASVVYQPPASMVTEQLQAGSMAQQQSAGSVLQTAAGLARQKTLTIVPQPAASFVQQTTSRVVQQPAASVQQSAANVVLQTALGVTQQPFLSQNIPKNTNSNETSPRKNAGVRPQNRGTVYRIASSSVSNQTTCQTQTEKQGANISRCIRLELVTAAVQPDVLRPVSNASDSNPVVSSDGVIHIIPQSEDALQDDAPEEQEYDSDATLAYEESRVSDVCKISPKSVNEISLDLDNEDQNEDGIYSNVIEFDSDDDDEEDDENGFAEQFGSLISENGKEERNENTDEIAEGMKEEADGPQLVISSVVSLSSNLEEAREIANAIQQHDQEEIPCHYENSVTQCHVPQPEICAEPEKVKESSKEVINIQPIPDTVEQDSSDCVDAKDRLSNTEHATGSSVCKIINYKQEPKVVAATLGSLEGTRKACDNQTPVIYQEKPHSHLNDNYAEPKRNPNGEQRVAEKGSSSPSHVHTENSDVNESDNIGHESKSCDQKKSFSKEAEATQVKCQDNSLENNEKLNKTVAKIDTNKSGTSCDDNFLRWGGEGGSVRVSSVKSVGIVLQIDQLPKSKEKELLQPDSSKDDKSSTMSRQSEEGPEKEKIVPTKESKGSALSKQNSFVENLNKSQSFHHGDHNTEEEMLGANAENEKQDLNRDREFTDLSDDGSEIDGDSVLCGTKEKNAVTNNKKEAYEKGIKSQYENSDVIDKKDKSLPKKDFVSLENREKPLQGTKQLSPAHQTRHKQIKPGKVFAELTHALHATLDMENDSEINCNERKETKEKSDLSCEGNKECIKDSYSADQPIPVDKDSQNVTKSQKKTYKKPLSQHLSYDEINELHTENKRKRHVNKKKVKDKRRENNAKRSSIDKGSVKGLVAEPNNNESFHGLSHLSQPQNHINTNLPWSSSNRAELQKPAIVKEAGMCKSHVSLQTSSFFHKSHQGSIYSMANTAIPTVPAGQGDHNPASASKTKSPSSFNLQSRSTFSTARKGYHRARSSSADDSLLSKHDRSQKLMVPDTVPEKPEDNVITDMTNKVGKLRDQTFEKRQLSRSHSACLAIGHEKGVDRPELNTRASDFKQAENDRQNLLFTGKTGNANPKYSNSSSWSSTSTSPRETPSLKRRSSRTAQDQEGFKSRKSGTVKGGGDAQFRNCNFKTEPPQYPEITQKHSSHEQQLYQARLFPISGKLESAVSDRVSYDQFKSKCIEEIHRYEELKEILNEMANKDKELDDPRRGILDLKIIRVQIDREMAKCEFHSEGSKPPFGRPGEKLSSDLLFSEELNAMYSVEGILLTLTRRITSMEFGELMKYKTRISELKDQLNGVCTSEEQDIYKAQKHRWHRKRMEKLRTYCEGTDKEAALVVNNEKLERYSDYKRKLTSRKGDKERMQYVEQKISEIMERIDVLQKLQVPEQKIETKEKGVIRSPSIKSKILPVKSGGLELKPSSESMQVQNVIKVEVSHKTSRQCRQVGDNPHPETESSRSFSSETEKTRSALKEKPPCPQDKGVCVSGISSVKGDQARASQNIGQSSLHEENPAGQGINEENERCGDMPKVIKSPASSPTDSKCAVNKALKSAPYRSASAESYPACDIDGVKMHSSEKNPSSSMNSEKHTKTLPACNSVSSVKEHDESNIVEPCIDAKLKEVCPSNRKVTEQDNGQGSNVTYEEKSTIENNPSALNNISRIETPCSILKMKRNKKKKRQGNTNPIEIPLDMDNPVVYQTAPVTQPMYISLCDIAKYKHCSVDKTSPSERQDNIQTLVPQVSKHALEHLKDKKKKEAKQSTLHSENAKGILKNPGLKSGASQEHNMPSNQNKMAHSLQERHMPSNQEKKAHSLPKRHVPSNQGKKAHSLQEPHMPSNQEKKAHSLQERHVPSNQDKKAHSLQEPHMPSNQDKKTHSLALNKTSEGTDGNISKIKKSAAKPLKRKSQHGKNVPTERSALSSFKIPRLSTSGRCEADGKDQKEISTQGPLNKTTKETNTHTQSQRTPGIKKDSCKASMASSFSGAHKCKDRPETHEILHVSNRDFHACQSRRIEERKHYSGKYSHRHRDGNSRMYFERAERHERTKRYGRTNYRPKHDPWYLHKDQNLPSEEIAREHFSKKLSELMGDRSEVSESKTSETGHVLSTENLRNILATVHQHSNQTAATDCETGRSRTDGYFHSSKEQTGSPKGELSEQDPHQSYSTRRPDVFGSNPLTSESGRDHTHFGDVPYNINTSNADDGTYYNSLRTNNIQGENGLVAEIPRNVSYNVSADSHSCDNLQIGNPDGLAQPTKYVSNSSETHLLSYDKPQIGNPDGHAQPPKYVSNSSETQVVDVDVKYLTDILRRINDATHNSDTKTDHRSSMYNDSGLTVEVESGPSANESEIEKTLKSLREQAHNEDIKNKASHSDEFTMREQTHTEDINKVDSRTNESHDAEPFEDQQLNAESKANKVQNIDTDRAKQITGNSGELGVRERPAGHGDPGRVHKRRDRSKEAAAARRLSRSERTPSPERKRRRTRTPEGRHRKYDGERRPYHWSHWDEKRSEFSDKERPSHARHENFAESPKDTTSDGSMYCASRDRDYDASVYTDDSPGRRHLDTHWAQRNDFETRRISPFNSRTRHRSPSPDMRSRNQDFREERHPYHRRRSISPTVGNPRERDGRSARDFRSPRQYRHGQSPEPFNRHVSRERYTRSPSPVDSSWHWRDEDRNEQPFCSSPRREEMLDYDPGTLNRDPNHEEWQEAQYEDPEWQEPLSGNRVSSPPRGYRDRSCSFEMEVENLDDMYEREGDVTVQRRDSQDEGHYFPSRGKFRARGGFNRGRGFRGQGRRPFRGGRGFSSRARGWNSHRGISHDYRGSGKYRGQERHYFKDRGRGR